MLLHILEVLSDTGSPKWISVIAFEITKLGAKSSDGDKEGIGGKLLRGVVDVNGLY